MTQLTITPKVADKTARFKGTVAAGEHVAVTIKGGAEWMGEDGDRSPVLRVIDCTTRRTLAVFPYWTEDNRDDWPEDVSEPDAWATSGDDDEEESDLVCTLNLNTIRMVAAARHMLRVPVLFVLGDSENPRTLYFCDRYEVGYWPERIGDTVPYDLDRWPKRIDEWQASVDLWTERMDNMKLSAEYTPRTETELGKVTITLNDGNDAQDTVVEIHDGEDGEVTEQQLQDGLDTKQDLLEFDSAPTDGSTNPVTSGGVKTAVDTVAAGLSSHVNNADIHVTALQKTAWSAKYDRPAGGIPKSDLAAGVQASLALADTALQAHQSLDAYVNGGVYDSNAKKILLKHGSTTIAEIDATAFIKDGMVDGVEVSGGNLVISFNTDAGIEDIEIPLTDIFNPSNYYDKTAADNRFVQKEAGKGLFSGSYNDLTGKPALAAVATSGSYNDLSGRPTIPAPVPVDPTLSTQGAAADAKAVGGALGEKLSTGGGNMTGGINFYSGGLDKGTISGKGYTDPNTNKSVAWPSNVSQNDVFAMVSQIPDVSNKANASDVAAALEQKADASDLPYKLVVPGKWEFSGVPSGMSCDVVGYNSESHRWEVSIWQTSDPDTAVSVYDSTHGEDTGIISVIYYDLSTPREITATRSSLPGHLLDRAGNRVVVSGDTTLTLPAAITGYARDFLVRLEISGSAVPTITFAAPTGETITYETDGDEFPVPDEAASWIYSFTETKAGVFAVALKKVAAVAQGGAA